jgi:hypothetical protein
MKKFTLTLATGLLIAGILLLTLPSGTVFAQEPDPPDWGREKQRDRSAPFFPRGEKGLERLFDRLVDRYEDMGYRINDTDDVTRKLDDRIEDLIEDGGDPSDLEAILADFRENMGAVQAAHDAAGAIIEAHAGFNDAGEVEDESMALLTLRQIAEGLLEVHQLGEDAKLALRWDVLMLRYHGASKE